MIRTSGSWAAMLALFALVLGGCTTNRSADLAIVGALVHDGGRGPPRSANVLVRDGRILEMGRSRRARRTIDARGQHLVPGLIDMHVHMAAVRGKNIDGQAFLASGITHVRDLGGFADQISAAKQAARPRVTAALSTVNGKQNAPFQVVAASPTDASRVVEQLAAAGADLIKVHRALDPQVLPAIVAAARRRGLKVTGHIPLGLHPLGACQAGMDGIEHVGSFVEAYVSAVKGASQDDAIRYLLSPSAEPLYRCLRDAGITVTPTLVLYASIARARSGGKPISEQFQQFIRSMGAITLRLHRSGIRLLPGSDASGLDTPKVEPGAALIEELGLLQEAGIPAPQVLEIAWANPARELGLSDGRLIARGMPADLLLLPHDPRADLRALRSPLVILLGGEQIQPSSTSRQSH